MLQDLLWQFFTALAQNDGISTSGLKSIAVVLLGLLVLCGKSTETRDSGKQLEKFMQSKERLCNLLFRMENTEHACN